MINTGTATLNYCTVAGNAVTGSNAGGGGIRVARGSVFVKNCTIFENTATTSGGGLSWLGGTVTVDNNHDRPCSTQALWFRLRRGCDYAG